MEQAIAFSSGEVIRPEHLAEDLFATTPALCKTKMPPLKQFMLQKKREYTEYVVKLVDGDYKQAADLLGIPANGFHSFLRRLNLSHLLR